MKIKLPLIFLLIFSFVDAQVPSTWSSSSTYTSGALALDANGVTYIAQQDVSTGIALSNTTYWKSLDAAAPTSAPSTSAPHDNPRHLDRSNRNSRHIDPNWSYWASGD